MPLKTAVIHNRNDSEKCAVKMSNHSLHESIYNVIETQLEQSTNEVHDENNKPNTMKLHK